MIIEFEGKKPKIHPSAWVAPTAVIIGDVEIGPDASVFYGCVLRGDVNAIRVGARTNIQDNSVLHVDADAPCILGDDVTIGHMALVHGTTVGDGTLVGMKSTLLSRSVIGAGALIAAGAVVTRPVPAFALMAGVPARRIGWVSRAGEILDITLVCPRTGERYEQHGETLRPAEPPVE